MTSASAAAGSGQTASNTGPATPSPQDTAAWQKTLAAANAQTQPAADTTKPKGMPITDAERKAAAAGDAQTFWTLRKAQGDPVADAGLASLHPASDPKDYLIGGTSINNRLEAFSRVYTGHSADIEGIRKDLMRAHVSAVDADTKGVPGLLDPGQIYDYHVEVFAKHGLPATTFGGSPLTGARLESFMTRAVWCGGCDR